MELELVPQPSEPERAAVLAAIATAGVDLDPHDDAYRSAWRRAGLVEGVRRRPPPVSYAFSPRSMRGALRA